MTESEFNTNTEVVSAWLVFISLSLLVGMMYYFTVIRQPPKPIMEWLFDRLVIPVSLSRKAEKGWAFVKHETARQLDRVPQKWRKYVPFEILPDDTKTSKTSLEETKPNSVNEIANETEPSAVIIGAPLDEDEETVAHAPIN